MAKAGAVLIGLRSVGSRVNGAGLRFMKLADKMALALKAWPGVL